MPFDPTEDRAFPAERPRGAASWLHYFVAVVLILGVLVLLLGNWWPVWIF